MRAGVIATSRGEDSRDRQSWLFRRRPSVRASYPAHYVLHTAALSDARPAPLRWRGNRRLSGSWPVAEPLEGLVLAQESEGETKTLGRKLAEIHAFIQA